MVSYPFRDIEPSTVNDCFGSRLSLKLSSGMVCKGSIFPVPIRHGNVESGLLPNRCREPRRDILTKPT